MAQPTLLILAAGMGSRYGGLKQLDPVGPSGETVIDYSVFDAIRSGFGKVVFVIRKDFEDEFKQRIGQRFTRQVEVSYAYQSIESLPEGFSVPEGRQKPWGTGHAILTASGVVHEPFAVINADDFYGKDAYQKIGQYLSQTFVDASPSTYCMVGYSLKNTLSNFGTVSRGICEIGSDGKLESVMELTKIGKHGEGALHVEADGHEIKLSGSEIVSMNMWGFTPAVFGQLEQLFAQFLRRQGEDLNSEFYIPHAVDKLIRGGLADVDVLRTTSSWFGVTYKEDRDHVKDSIRMLVDKSEYPESIS